MFKNKIKIIYVCLLIAILYLPIFIFVFMPRLINSPYTKAKSNQIKLIQQGIISHTKTTYNQNDNPLNTNNRIILDAEEIHEKYNKACVAIQLNNTFGSGFFVSKNGIIFTNSHVIKGSKLKDIKIIDSDGLYHSVSRIIHNNPKSDIALLQMADKNVKVIIKLCNPLYLQRGEKCFNISCINGNLNSITDGIIMNFKDSTGDKNNIDIIISNYVAGGASGGVLINQSGEGVGMLYAKDISGDSCGYAISGQELIDVLKQLKIMNE